MTTQRTYNSEEERDMDLSYAVQQIYDAKEELQVHLSAQEESYFRGNGYDADEVLQAALALVADLQTLKAIERANIIQPVRKNCLEFPIGQHSPDEFNICGFCGQDLS